MAEHVFVFLVVFSCLVSTSNCEDSPPACSELNNFHPRYVPKLETKQGTPLASIQLRCNLKRRDIGKMFGTFSITSFMSNFVTPKVDGTDSSVMVYLHVRCYSPMEVRFINSLNTVYNKTLMFLRLSGGCSVSMQTLPVLANATNFRGIHLSDSWAEFPDATENVRGFYMRSTGSNLLLIQPEGRREKFATSLTEIAHACLPWKDFKNIVEMFNNTQNVFPNLAQLAFTAASISVQEILTDQWKSVMPNLQYLDLRFNFLTKPPVFPWNNLTLEILSQFRRGSPDNKVDVAQNLYIRGLDLTGNKIEDLSSHEFRGFFHKLLLQDNGLNTIGPTCFHGLRGIQLIDLSENSLTSLPKNLFQGLTSLLTINLGINRISRIDQSLFYGLVKIKRIFLYGNRISYVGGGLFKALNNLEVLRLDLNNIKKINGNPFSPYSMLRQLYLDSNSLSSFPSWIFRLDRIEEVSLSSNQLTLLDLKAVRPYKSDTPFGAKRQLDIDLIYNEITTLKLTSPWATAISGITAFGFLSATPEPYNFVLRAVNIRLNGNPLTCDCNLFATTKQIRNITSSTKSRFSNWRCGWPPELQHKSIFDIEDNQWMLRREPDNCPAKCSCKKRCSDEVVVIDCGSMNLTEVPNSMPQGLIELDLSKNNIKDIPEYDYLINVTVLKLTNNRVEQLNASLVQKLKHVKTFLIDLNQLTSLPRQIETLNFTTMALGENNFKCDCETKWMTKWLRNNKGRIGDYENVLCKSGNLELRGKKIGSLTGDKLVDVCDASPSHLSATTPKTSDKPSSKVTKGNLSTGTIAALCLGVLLVIVVITVILLYKYQGEVKVFMFTRFNWHPFDRIDDSDPNKIYDAFISYSGEDFQWVVNTLQKGLENHNPPYKLCLHHRDFRVGALIQENIFNSVDHSKRMIMVLSSNFAKSEWCLLEFRFAHQKVLQDRINYLIIILFDDVDMSELDEEIKLYMRTNTYVKVSDEWFWQKLFYSMPQCSAKESVNESALTIIPDSR